MDEKSNKVKLLVYATEDDRARIKMAAAKLHMSMSQLILDSVLEQVASIEELEKNGGAQAFANAVSRGAGKTRRGAQVLTWLGGVFVWFSDSTIAVMNQKGGTGKTTSAINLAGELVRRGKKVLIVDMDTQGNATSNLSLTEIPAATLTDVIVSKTATLADTVCHTTTENLDLIRGGSLLAPALATMQEMPFGRDTTLRRLLPQIPDTYDFVFFDCSPSLESLFNINVLVAVQYVLIPIKVDKNSIEGYDVMLETIQSVREIANPDIRALGIFMTAVETGSSLDREMIANFPAMLPGLAFQTYIRKNIDVKKAPLALQPLCFFSPRCTATGDYAALCDEMLARMEG